MPREENGPVRQQEDFGSGQPKLADVYRPSDESLIRQQIKLMRSHFEEQKEMLDKFKDDISRFLYQHEASLEQGAWQPRLAVEADGPGNTKTRERTEGASTAVQSIHRDSFSTCRVDPGPETSTSFSVKAEPPARPCRKDILVEDGAAAPKSCLPSLEMRSPTADGGLVPTGKTFKATEITVLQFYSTKEEDSRKKKLWTSIPSTSYYSSVFQKSNLPFAPYCRRAVETKFR